MSNYMAIDQYGQTYHNLGKHPRKELMKRIGSQHVSKIYQDRKDGSTVHVGYVIGQHWCTLYEVKSFVGNEAKFHCELIKASSYYKNNAPGWVALVNGQPHHVKNKAEAQEFINHFGRFK